MKGNRFLHVLKIVVMVAVAITAFSFVTMQLWNWLMPAVFGLHAITCGKAGAGAAAAVQDSVWRDSIGTAAEGTTGNGSTAWWRNGWR